VKISLIYKQLQALSKRLVNVWCGPIRNKHFIISIDFILRKSELRTGTLASAT
jgi:hypothetical protein